MKSNYLWKLLIPLTFLIILSSCNKWIAPPYTSPDKILQVKNEMNLEQVNETLGIEPYNMLHKNDSTSLFEYHYRLRDREINNISNYKKFIHSAKSLTGGESWFDKPSKLYALYENNGLKTIITKNGLENSDYLLLKNNNLMLVSESDLVKLKLTEDASYLKKIGETQKLDIKHKLKHVVLVNSYIPWGELGLKYMLFKKFGGYASFGYSLEYGEISYVFMGVSSKIKDAMNINIGIGSSSALDEYRDSFNDLSILSAEAGINYFNESLAFDFGLGYTIGKRPLYQSEYFFIKIGVGINF
jgi:hypothetical protein